MLDLATILERLRSTHGTIELPPPRTPFAILVWDACAYLVDDDRRLEVYRRIEAEVGLTPEAILDCNDLSDRMKAGGMHPERRALRLFETAHKALEIGLDEAVKLPLEEALEVLKKFPGQGEPGAEKILLLSGHHAVLALESNGVRTLWRLGYAAGTDPEKNYAATYAALRDELQVPNEIDEVQQAHVLLRRHGQTICKRTQPLCPECPLLDGCPTGSASSPSLGGRGAA
jgi:endonuclease-3